MPKLSWMTNEILGDLIAATHAEEVLVPMFMKTYFELEMKCSFKVSYSSQTKNIKFLTRQASGSMNGPLNELVKDHQIPKRAFEVIDMATDDSIDDVKKYLFDSWKAEPAMSRREFMEKFWTEYKPGEQKSDSSTSTNNWRQDGLGELQNDLNSFFDKNGMKPVTAKIKTKSGKTLHISVQVVNGEVMAKLFDELTKKYGPEFVKEHIKVVSGMELKELLERGLGEEIESMEFAGGELDPNQFSQAMQKYDENTFQSTFSQKMQDLLKQSKEKIIEEVKKENPTHTVDEDDPVLREIVKRMQNSN